MNTKTYNKRRISSSKSNILADLNDMESEFEVVNYMKKVFDEHGKPELYEKFCEEVDNSDDVPGVVAEKYVNKIFNSRRISSSQKGMENVAEGTKYDDYHIDTKGMGILSVENIIEEIEGRGNQAVLTVQTSDGSTNHSQFGSKDWKEYKDSVNDAGNAITDVWVTEVEGGSYVRNSRQIKSSTGTIHCVYLSDITPTEWTKAMALAAIGNSVTNYGYYEYNGKKGFCIVGDFDDIYNFIESIGHVVDEDDLYHWKEFPWDEAKKLDKRYGGQDYQKRKGLTNSRRPVKSGVPFKNRGFNLTSHEIQDMEWRINSGETVDYNGWTFVKDDDFDTIIATSPEGKTYDGFKSLSGFMDLYEYGSIESSRRPVKSSVRWSNDDYVVETFEYGNGEFYVSDKDTDGRKFCKTFWSEKDAVEWAKNNPLKKVNSSRQIKSARYIATDPESGEVLGSADTYEEAVNQWGEDVTITDSEATEGQEEGGLFQSRKITSAVDGGWEVRSSDVPEALDLFVEYFGKEDALEEIAKAMGDNTLEENIDWIAQQWGFAEEIEDKDVWDKYETAKELMGESELFNNLTQAAGYDELAEDLAFIFRMNDFREWDKYDNEDEDDEWEDDEEIESSLQNSFPIRTVKNIMSGAWTEERAAQNIAQKQDINVGYARQILSSWIEQYKPKLIKSGILDIAEDINTEFDIDGDLESWAEQYTNNSGKSNTVGGEMVRAAMQIIYRYNNDGDMIGRGYGNETVNAAARYITEKAEMGVNEQIQKWLDHEERANADDYDSFIETFTTEIEQILRENPELFQRPNKDDYWNWKEDEDMNYGLDEVYLDDGNGNQYWFRLSNDRWTCTGIELDPYSITYQEGDTINEGDEYSDEILSPSEEFGSFEADGFIYEYAGDDWNDEREQYTSWQITSVKPQDPYCDDGDTFDFYDLEPDELYGYTLYDHNGNEVDERTFLASSLKVK